MRRKIPDRVVAACERAFERFISEYSRTVFPQVPIIGGTYCTARNEDHVRSVCKALAAVEQHKQTANYTWANPLPLREEEFETFINNKCNALKLLGFFGRSWRWNNWDEQHPVFDVFCSGITEWSLSPWELKMDKELLQMFPPRALPGLTHPLQWRPPR